MVGYVQAYDPLALNIGSTPNAAPKVGSGTVEFPLSYIGSNNYGNVEVKWPVEEGGSNYRFIVNKAFTENENNRHVGNMFSDQISRPDNKQYDTGFDQLQDQYDADNDNIITRDELSELYIMDDTWVDKSTSYTYIPLTNFVLDINLYKVEIKDANGNSVRGNGAYYDMQGNYRKLVALDSAPTCAGTCAKYIGYNRDNLDDEIKEYVSKLEEGDDNNKYKAEVWQDIKDNNTYYYYLRKIGGEPTDYSKEDWKKIVKHDMTTENVTSLPDENIREEITISSSNVPKELYNIIKNESGIKLYKNKDSKNIYYTSDEENEEIVKYELSSYTSENVNANNITKYFKNGNNWYRVVIAKVTDIVFELNK